MSKMWGRSYRIVLYSLYRFNVQPSHTFASMQGGACMFWLPRPDKYDDGKRKLWPCGPVKCAGNGCRGKGRCGPLVNGGGGGLFRAEVCARARTMTHTKHIFSISLLTRRLRPSQRDCFLRPNGQHFPHDECDPRLPCRRPSPGLCSGGTFRSTQTRLLLGVTRSCNM